MSGLCDFLVDRRPAGVTGEARSRMIMENTFYSKGVLLNVILLFLYAITGCTTVVLFFFFGCSRIPFVTTGIRNRAHVRKS